MLPLARGALSDAEREDLHALKRQIFREAGLYCRGYKEKCLRRRLAVRMRACGVHRYGEYARLLEDDEEEYGRLLTALTINVTKFFRNAEVWQVLRESVVPELFSQADRRVRIWSAGTASGEESYSLAIELLEYARKNRCEDELRRFRILATDIDPTALASAARAEYGELALSETPVELRDRWFVGDGPFRVREEVKQLVRFRRADLIQDATPEAQHLILCRNVFIYFEREVQERIFERFIHALSSGGYLVLGKVEALFGDHADAFAAISHRERIFQKR